MSEGLCPVEYAALSINLVHLCPKWPAQTGVQSSLTHSCNFVLTLGPRTCIFSLVKSWALRTPCLMKFNLLIGTANGAALLPIYSGPMGLMLDWCFLLLSGTRLHPWVCITVIQQKNPFRFAKTGTLICKVAFWFNPADVDARKTILQIETKGTYNGCCSDVGLWPDDLVNRHAGEQRAAVKTRVVQFGVIDKQDEAPGLQSGFLSGWGKKTKLGAAVPHMIFGKAIVEPSHETWRWQCSEYIFFPTMSRSGSNIRRRGIRKKCGQMRGIYVYRARANVPKWGAKSWAYL